MANNWTANISGSASNYLAIYTLSTTSLPNTYSYNGVTYTKTASDDVSEAQNGSVIFNTYKNGSNYIGVIGQKGGVVAPVDSSGLFSEFSNAQAIDLSSFNTSKTENIEGMFAGCESLEKLDLSNFDTSNVTTMEYMFTECSNLKTLDIRNFMFQNVKNYNGIFSGISEDGITITIGCNTDHSFSTLLNVLIRENIPYETITICN